MESDANVSGEANEPRIDTNIDEYRKEVARRICLSERKGERRDGGWGYDLSFDERFDGFFDAGGSGISSVHRFKYAPTPFGQSHNHFYLSCDVSLTDPP